MTAARCWLYPGVWTRLPGTEVEVFLHGKRRSQERWEVPRTGTGGRVGGWDIGPLRERIFVRRVRS